MTKFDGAEDVRQRPCNELNKCYYVEIVHSKPPSPVVADAHAQAQQCGAARGDQPAGLLLLLLVAVARAERNLLAQIAAAEAHAADAGVPPVLRGRIGPQAVQAWAELGGEGAAKREIIRTVAQVKLLRAGKGTRQPFGRHRLVWV